MRKFYSQNVLSTHLSTIFHYTTLFRSLFHGCGRIEKRIGNVHRAQQGLGDVPALRLPGVTLAKRTAIGDERSEEHTSELQSPMYLVCRLLLEKKDVQTSINVIGDL